MKNVRSPQALRKLQIKSIAAVSVAFFGLQALFLNATPVKPEGQRTPPGQAKKFAAGQILVQMKAGLSDEDADQIFGRHNGKSKKKINQIRLHVVDVPVGSEQAIAQSLSEDPNVDFAEVDGMVAPDDIIVNDTNVGSEWHIPKISAPAAWSTATGEGITIAILDSGVDGNHPDLVAHMVPGYNFYDNNTNTDDVFGHGTLVAGSAAGVGNNSLGVAGVAWNAKIMPIRVSDTAGYAYWSTLSSGLTYAVDHGAKVANMSFQAHLGASVISAAQYMMSKGGVAVNSAGNTGAIDTTPASDYLVSVSATDSNDARTGWSSFGPYVDVSAPGAGIYTTQGAVRGGGYAYCNGTSFSAPITAGVVALMMQANPKLPPQQIVQLLKSTATDLGDAGWDQYYGTGRVNAAAAVQAAASVVVVDSTAPTVSFSGLSSGSVVKGQQIIDVNAADNIGVAKVDLYANGALVGTDTTSPYSFSLNTTAYADGNLTLMVKASDSSGNSSSSSLTVSVRNTVDSIAPVINSVSPTSGSVLGRNSATVSASASDNIGVVSMIVIIDGAQKASSSSGSISYGWNVRKVSSGTHTIEVRAQDAMGNVTSKVVQVIK